MIRFSLYILLTIVCLTVQAGRRTDDVFLSEASSHSAHAQHRAGDVVEVSDASADRFFTISTIPADVMDRMRGKSLPQGKEQWAQTELRYVRVLHINREGKTQIGELVCNKAIAKDLVEILRELYKARYRIARMVLIDEYDADDEKSMAANNTTCFNYRLMTGSDKKLSMHGYGLAIDINPLFNPYVRGNTVQPANGRKFAKKPEIDSGGICYRLFTSHGFKWGGDWKTIKDYQHFEKSRR